MTQSASTLYPLADPLGAASINVFRPGWYHAWHFDEAEFTTTLCLQDAEVGGAFEYSLPLRTTGDSLAAEDVAAVINAHSEYRVEPAAGREVREVPFPI